MANADLQKLITPLLPEPGAIEQTSDNSVTLTGGDPGAVIVRITAAALEARPRIYAECPGNPRREQASRRKGTFRKIIRADAMKRTRMTAAALAVAAAR